MGGQLWIYDPLKITILWSPSITSPLSLGTISRWKKSEIWLINKQWYGTQYLFAALLGVVTPFCSLLFNSTCLWDFFLRIPVWSNFHLLISSPLVNESSLFCFQRIRPPGNDSVQPHRYGNCYLWWLVDSTAKIREICPARYFGFYWQKTATAKISRSVNSLERTLQAVDEWNARYHQENLSIRSLGSNVGRADSWPGASIAHFWFAIWVRTLVGASGCVTWDSALCQFCECDSTIEALVGKGVPMGTALAFMTATVTLSIPEALMLKKNSQMAAAGGIFRNYHGGNRTNGLSV